jgi:hypothetical protein
VAGRRDHLVAFFVAEGRPSMSAQLPGWLSFIVAIPCAVVAILQICGFRSRRQHRRAMRITQLQVWGITWTRLDVSNDDQL